MQGLPYEIKLHLLTYMGAREYCHFVQTCRSFATINQQDTNKLFYQMYLRDYVPLLRPFTKADMEEWFVPFHDSLKVARIPEQRQLDEFMDDIDFKPLKNGKRLERLRTPKYAQLEDWRRLYQLLHATKMNALKMMRQHAQSLLLLGETPKVSFVHASPGLGVGALLHTSIAKLNIRKITVSTSAVCTCLRVILDTLPWTSMQMLSPTGIEPLHND
jgi:hypothetical protein